MLASTYRSNAARPGGRREKKVHKALCSASASRNSADSKRKSCNPGHSARVVQRELYSASAGKSCTDSKDYSKDEICLCGVVSKDPDVCNAPNSKCLPTSS